MTARWVVLLLVGVALATSIPVTLLHSDALSPLDEWVYIDYIYKVPEQGMVFKGEPVGEQALDIMACDGVTPYGLMGGSCGSDYDYHDFPFGGITSADPYLPVFFAMTRLVGDAISWVTGVDSLTGWRLTGSLWLVGALIAFAATLRLWRVDRFAILGLGVAFIGSPLSFWTYSFVSTDAPAFLIGALLLYLVTRYVRGEIRGWGIIVIAAVAAAFKITNLLGVGMAALVLIVAAVTRARGSTGGFSLSGSPIRMLGVAAGSLLAGITVQVSWLTLTRVTQVSTEFSDQSAIAQQLTVQEALSQVVNFLPGTIAYNVPITGGSGFILPFPGFVGVPLTWICIGGVVAALLRLTVIRGERAAMVIGVAAAAALAGPILAIALQVFLSSYFTLPARYGASLLPGFLLLAGMMLRNRWMSIAIGLYGLALCAATIYASAILGRT